MLGLSRDVTARELAGLGSDGRRLTTKEAAEYLGIGESTLEKWRCSGSGPEFERVGTRIVRYRISSLETFLAARRAMSTSEPPVRNAAPSARTAIKRPRSTARPRQQYQSRRSS